MYKRLADIVEVRTGFPFRGRVDSVVGGTLSVVQMKDVDDSAGLLPERCLRIADDGPRYGKHLLRPGDVLLQSRGSKFPAVVVDKAIHGIAALGLMVIRPGETVLPAYLKWVLNHEETRNAMRGVAQGSHIPFLSRVSLEALRIPMPSLEVQGRIAAIDRLRHVERSLRDQLSNLSNQYTDTLVWNAATSTPRKNQ